MGVNLRDSQKAEIADIFVKMSDVKDYLHAWAQSWYSDAELIDNLNKFRNEARAKAREDRKTFELSLVNITQKKEIK